jgi:hypothetical protein
MTMLPVKFKEFKHKIDLHDYPEPDAQIQACLDNMNKWIESVRINIICIETITVEIHSPSITIYWLRLFYKGDI